MADAFRKYSRLEHLSVDRLEELLDLAVNTDDENSEYVDTLLAEMVKKKRVIQPGESEMWTRHGQIFKLIVIF